MLINITGGLDMTLFEVDEAANRIRAEVDPDANIIFGGTILENMEGRMRVSVVATGIEAEALAKMPANVEPLKAYRKAAPLPTRAEVRAAEMRPVATPSPVHHQMETLAQELNARPHAAQPEPMNWAPWTRRSSKTNPCRCRLSCVPCRHASNRCLSPNRNRKKRRSAASGSSAAAKRSPSRRGWNPFRPRASLRARPRK